jgi:hypothetical protein
MSSNIPMKDLKIGMTMPIKLKRRIERPATGQSIAFNKLAKLISFNFVARKDNK